MTDRLLDRVVRESDRFMPQYRGAKFCPSILCHGGSVTSFAPGVASQWIVDPPPYSYAPPITGVRPLLASTDAWRKMLDMTVQGRR